MKVQFDHQIFTWQKFGGISRYFYELIKNSDGLYDAELSCKYSQNTYIQPLGVCKEFPIHANFKGKDRVISFLNKRESLKSLKSNAEIFHPTYYGNYFIGKTKGCKTVLTVYDMIHEKFPQFFLGDMTAQIKKNAVFAADLIIAISESTKKDMMEFYPSLNPEKIKIVYLGNSLQKVYSAERKKDYILFTGQRWHYKNFENFAKAISPLLKKYNLQLKCTGAPFTEREKEFLKSLEIGDRTEHVFANDNELSALYANALLFCFPSQYEGFGIPVLEAFASGCPLVCSNQSSLPEIGGTAAVYFDPYSVEDIRKKIELVISSETLQYDLIKKGFERLKIFSWKQCAEQTANLYRQVLA